MDWIPGAVQAVIRVSNFNSLGRFGHSRRRRHGAAGVALAGAMFAPWASGPAMADQNGDLTAKIKAAPDAIMLKCVSPDDTDYVTISRRLHALVIMNVINPNRPDVYMDGVSTNGTVMRVAFLDDGVQWAPAFESIPYIWRIDRKTLEMTFSEEGYVGIRFSCVRVENRNQF